MTAALVLVKTLPGNTTETHYRHDDGIIASIFVALLSFIFTCIINGLARRGSNKLFKKSTAQISDENPSEFTPASPTFSIWGLVYTWQLVFLVYSIVNIWRKTDDGFLYIHPYTLHAAIFILFIVNMFLNSFWLILWDRFKFGLSACVIYVMLTTIVGICVLDHIFLWQQRWDFIQLNISGDIWAMCFIALNGHAAYSAWLLVAASLNLTIWLKRKLLVNFEGWATTFSLILLSIGIIVYWILENFIFPSQMAYTWSPWLIWFLTFAGILSKHRRLLLQKSFNQIFVLTITCVCFGLFIIRVILFSIRYSREEIPTGLHPAGL
ncbi:unnamed protein product [Rotaria magnacalcarata]|uniref:Uncharacterized protein n=1 Tax=Rotaria magnacalcarata TaxID=392030 RepID=A0A817AYK1_9BILA|nr:unnamed protein product [Rotaria magnacalcarata]CAF2031293.1 unnamed protein product [Rotaria magnacalcarata]CAF2268782.1 unnamed protein product [Rotaria magnacalcarata]